MYGTLARILIDCELPMRALVVLLSTLLVLWSVTSADSKTIRMKPGNDAFVFDDKLYGQTFSVFTAEGEPPGGEITEVVYHQIFRLEDILEVVPEVSSNFTMGIANIQNAYAVIHNNDRFIVMSPNWLPSDQERILVLAHEIGHHVCGHTKGALASDPWAKELEADRFSGFVVRRFVDKHGLQNARINLPLAIQVANGLYAGSGGDHPTRDLRVQAIYDGYNQGTGCLRR